MTIPGTNFDRLCAAIYGNVLVLGSYVENLSLYDLASYNETTQAWETAPGKYTISFGASVEDIRATAPYKLAKQHTVKCHDVMKPNMQL